ncbi:MAG: branched chain amino acid ABC transporter substrate-binding protein [Actinobacteria bacterium HGW-Actinobacteria-7]|nr:MAG: branched chain amino acid ABC transporter substrate-binding protein [Actinobacteria bacterium HGW-Actinobacteria-7]
MNRFARTSVTLLAGAAFVAALAGCSAQTPAEPATGGPAAASMKVKIGFAAPLTGDNAIYGEGMKRAVELAIEEANASSDAKAKGITFSIHAEDDAGDPKQAVNVANILAGDTDVVALVGHFNSGCSIPASPVYNEASMAMVTVSSNPQLTAQGYKVVDRVVAKDDAQGGYAGKLASDMGFDTVALIDDATPYGQGLATEFKKAYTSAGGSIVAEDRIQPKEVNFSALVTKLKKKAPKAVYYAGAHTEGALLSKQLKEAGLKVPVMGGDMLYTPEYIKIAGADNAEGDMATALGLPLEQQPKGVEFKTKYEAKYGKAPEAYDSYAYDAALTIINAVMTAGNDRAAVAEAIRAGSIDGVTGTVAFDANGDNKQQVISAYKVEGGEWKQIQQ